MIKAGKNTGKVHQNIKILSFLAQEMSFMWLAQEQDWPGWARR